MTAVPLLEVEGLHTYYGASHILQGISFTIRSGEAVSLMGRNGMGKTTTLRSIFGLTAPQSGTVRVGGRELTGAPPHVIARHGLALVPEGRGIFPNLSVEENLIMAARPGGKNSGGKAGGREEDWTLPRVLDLFPRLAERMNNMGDQLSGGEQQMLSISRALLTNPELLILDEATEGLAPLVRKEIWSVLGHIRSTGVATLIVDKDVNALLGVCDRCLILSKGQIVYSGTAAELAEQPEIHVRHLGV